MGRLIGLAGGCFNGSVSISLLWTDMCLERGLGLPMLASQFGKYLFLVAGNSIETIEY